MDAFHSHFEFAPVVQVHGDLFGAFVEMTAGEEITYVFATGPLRSKFYTDGAVKSAPHHTVDVTLRQVIEHNEMIHLKYLTNAEEASYGFETLLEHSKDVLDDAIVKAGIAARLVIVTTSGTTSFQSGVYDREAGTITRMDSFDYGTNNRNPQGLEAYKAWMASQKDVRDVVSIGSESYAAHTGKIATNQVDTANEFLSELDTSARAYEAVKDVFDVATSIGKAYYVPERKTWNAMTSATLALRKKYPTGALLDWGGGQIKDEEKKKSVKFDQRVLM